MFTVDKMWNPKHSVFVFILLEGIVWYDVFIFFYEGSRISHNTRALSLEKEKLFYILDNHSQ